MRPRSALSGYQEDAARRMEEAKRIVVLMRMGMGKTITTLTALVDLSVKKALIVAPATVVDEDVWGKEARAWEHTAHLDVLPLTGDAKCRLNKLTGGSRGPRAGKSGGDIEVISYENFLWLTDQGEVRLRYDAVVFDELSKVKNPGSSRFKRLRAKYIGTYDIPIRFGLTGTPVGNHLLDLWAEMYAVCGEAPLGPRFVDYKLQYFHSFDRRQLVWEPNHGAKEQILERIQPYAFSLDKSLTAGRIPPVRVNEIDVPLPPRVLAMEHELATQVKTVLESGTELVAFGASALAMKVRQLASGAVYTDPLDETKWEHVHEVKIERLKEMVDLMQGEPLLVFYWYRHELERLRKAFPSARIVGDYGAVDDWNAGKIEVLFAHPASAGHGLNLQHGGSTICWYTLPYSLELWMQANGRLARIGQKATEVVAHCLLAGDADRYVLDLLREKAAVEEDILAGCVMETRESLLADPLFG